MNLIFLISNIKGLLINAQLQVTSDGKRIISPIESDRYEEELVTDNNLDLSITRIQPVFQSQNDSTKTHEHLDFRFSDSNHVQEFNKSIFVNESIVEAEINSEHVSSSSIFQTSTQNRSSKFASCKAMQKTGESTLSVQRVALITKEEIKLTHSLTHYLQIWQF